MNIKPKVQIGEIVNIVKCDYIQTSNKFQTVHLSAYSFRKKTKYYVVDIKVEMSLKTGSIKYDYLISTDKNGESFSTGWVDGRNIELVMNKKVA